MSSLYLNGVSAPSEVKKALADLSKNINFTREDTKAGVGMVFFGMNRITGKDVAVKFYFWGGKAGFHAEPKQLAAIKSNNVLPIDDAGLVDHTWAYFITPACANGDLDDVLEKTNIGNLAAIDYAYQVLNGLSHLHEKRFLHRDLKPSNIYVSEHNIAMIGDFGSVKHLPDGQHAIPASSHSLLYRPPETITTNGYGMSGDIYQVGIILYQLLGGYLPYDGRAYLSKQDLKRLQALATPADEGPFIDQCIEGKVCCGRLLQLATMPPWVPDGIKKIIQKACHVDHSKRFQTTSAFMAKLHAIRPAVLDWKIEEGHPTLVSAPSYRVLDQADRSIVQKRGLNAIWRRDHSFGEGNLHDLVKAISMKIMPA